MIGYLIVWSLYSLIDNLINYLLDQSKAKEPFCGNRGEMLRISAVNGYGKVEGTRIKEMKNKKRRTQKRQRR